MPFPRSWLRLPGFSPPDWSLFLLRRPEGYGSACRNSWSSDGRATVSPGKPAYYVIVVAPKELYLTYPE